VDALTRITGYRQPVSGPANRRLALINNKTVQAGETTQIKAADWTVTIKCLAAQQKSVLLSIDGVSSPRELRL
jgi:hypothetical protein